MKEIRKKENSDFKLNYSLFFHSANFVHIHSTQRQRPPWAEHYEANTNLSNIKEVFRLGRGITCFVMHSLKTADVHVRGQKKKKRKFNKNFVLARPKKYIYRKHIVTFLK